MNPQAIKQGIQTFSPAYFALAMSTGIIAIASSLYSFPLLGRFFFILNNIELGVLLIILFFRVFLFFEKVTSDISSHADGSGFLTIPAATAILGTEYAVIGVNPKIAVLFWYLSLCFWIFLIYSFFIMVTIKKNKPSLENGMNGSWLLFVVSVQAISILGSTLSEYLFFSSEVTIFINSFLYLLGILFYLVVIGIIFYRTTFFPMRPDEFKPSYWIDMGAAAITTLSGITLIRSIEPTSAFSEFIPLIKFLSILFWIAGSWWIPVICFLEIRRHLQIPVKYNSGYWCLVFPLGVYSVCTNQLSEILNLNFLQSISYGIIFLAWLVWLIICIGMCVALIKLLFSPPHPFHPKY